MVIKIEQGMAPTTLLQKNTLPLATSNSTIIIVQDVGGPWALDLNTLVTIVFGVIGIALQAGQLYRGRVQRYICPMLDNWCEADETN